MGTAAQRGPILQGEKQQVDLLPFQQAGQIKLFGQYADRFPARIAVDHGFQEMTRRGAIQVLVDPAQNQMIGVGRIRSDQLGNKVAGIPFGPRLVIQKGQGVEGNVHGGVVLCSGNSYQSQ